MKFKVLAFLAATALSLPAHSSLLVTGSTDPDALANALAGAGVTISNASLIGVADQQGTFTGGIDAGIGIESGVILTSGSIHVAPGPNDLGDAGVNLGQPGDAQLNALIPGFTTFDANVLSFDFTTDTGDLFFRYVFASEEYNEYVDSEFNDVFGFFFDGDNIAVLPGTTTPVAINNVNNDLNSDFYVDNCGATVFGPCPDPSFNIQYDGFTTVLTAQILGLTAGQTYSIRLAIADAGDGILDSAVFLEAGSFTSVDPGPVGVPEPGTLALLGLGMLGMGAMRRRRVA